MTDKKYGPTLRISDEIRTCSKCGEHRTVVDFYKDKKGKGGRASRCKDCTKSATRLWKSANPEKAKAAVDRCFSVNREAYYSSHSKRQLLVKYGLTVDAYKELVESSGDCCPICTRLFGEQAYTKPVIDHCHSTGKVRGLICRQCNIGLGAFKDDTNSMENAIKYLKENYDKRD